MINLVPAVVQHATRKVVDLCFFALGMVVGKKLHDYKSQTTMAQDLNQVKKDIQDLKTKSPRN